MDQSPTTGNLQWWVFSTRPRTYQNLANLQVSLFQWSNFIVSTKHPLQMTQSRIHPRKSRDFQAAPSFNWTQQAQGPCSFGDPCFCCPRHFENLIMAPKCFHFIAKCIIQGLSLFISMISFCQVSYGSLADLIGLWGPHTHIQPLTTGYLSVYWDCIPKTTTMEPTNWRVVTMSFLLFWGDDFCSRSTSAGPSTFRTLSVTLRRWHAKTDWSKEGLYEMIL